MTRGCWKTLSRADGTERTDLAVRVAVVGGAAVILRNMYTHTDTNYLLYLSLYNL